MSITTPTDAYPGRHTRPESMPTAGFVLRAGSVLRAVVALVPVGALLLLGWHRRWVTDDAFINFRIVNNLVHGHGPVFNVGERVEASTSALWVFLLAAFKPLSFLPIEWWSVLLGLAGTVTGVVAAQRAAVVLTSRDGDRRIILPLGAGVLAAVPPMWDFTTSGLENGLGFGWIGVAFLLTARQCRDAVPRWRTVMGGAFVIGLGPLVRPDLGILWVGFSLAFLVACGARSWRHRVAIAALLIAVPVAYEIFRMGYFATLGPNTALSKEASLVRVGEGLRYLGDLVAPYWLGLALACAALVAVGVAPWKDRRRLLVWITPAVWGTVHGAYVVRVGGDYMHGRMLLPSLFAVVAPVMAVRISRLVVVPALVMACWAVVCAHSLRTPYKMSTADGFITNERVFYLARAAFSIEGHPPSHPVTLRDYRHVPFVPLALKARDLANRNARIYQQVLLDTAYIDQRPLLPGVRAPMVVNMGNLGMYGFAAGPQVFIADPAGLSDPIAARLKITKRGKPGHEKGLDPVWFQARYTNVTNGTASEKAAALALNCAPLRDVIGAADAPLTPRRFASNMEHAFAYWSLRIPNDPAAAAAQVCRS